MGTAFCFHHISGEAAARGRARATERKKTQEDRERPAKQSKHGILVGTRGVAYQSGRQ